MATTYDHVIVGAGAAGAVLAARLGEDAGRTICVLEAGPPDSNPYIRIPAGFMKTKFDPRVTWQFRSEPGAAIAGRRIDLVQGRTLGGGGAVNGMLYVRGQRRDFDGWAESGNHGWSYADVLPYFMRSECRIGAGDDRYRGRTGPIPVTDVDFPDVLCDAFIDSAVASGLPRNPDYNGATQHGAGRFQAAIQDGKRVSSARAFLRPARRRGNIDVRTHAQATRICVDGRRANGVEYRDGSGDTRTVSARRGVILAAGAINSPKLLQLSGIGPAALLRAHGVQVVHELAGVGENLRDHFGPRLVHRTRGVRSLNERARGVSLAVEIACWLLGRPSIIGVPPALCYAHAMSDPSLRDPDIGFAFAPASMKGGTFGNLDDFPGMTCATWKHRPDSRGHVRLSSNDPLAPPLIEFNYLSDERDRQVAVASLKVARTIFAAMPMAGYVAAELIPGREVVTDDELLDAARRQGSTNYHPVGTCRMGPAGDPGAVVGPDLAVHGIDGLHVVDASIMPAMPSANTYAATLMIAEKGADQIRGKAALPRAELEPVQP